MNPNPAELNGGPPPRTHRMTYREYASLNWAAVFAERPNGNVEWDKEAVLVGLAIRAVDALEKIAAAAGNIHSRLSYLDELVRLPITLGRVVDALDPDAREKAAAAKADRLRAKREAESRARAEAAMRGPPPTPPTPVVPPIDTADDPVDVLKLPLRVRRALNRMDIRTVGDLLALTAESFRGQPQFGAGSLAELRSKLAAVGLALADDRDAPPQE